MIPERVLYTFDATLQTEVIKEVHVIQEMQVELGEGAWKKSKKK